MYARWQWLVMIIYGHEAFKWHLFFGQYCSPDPCRLKRFTYVTILILPILGAFEKSRKATFSFVICVCPSADPSAWNNSAPAEPIFTKFYTVYFSKLFPENSSFIKIWQEWQVLNKYLTWRRMHLYIISPWILLRINISDKSVEKITIHILCSVTTFPKIMLFMR